MIYLASPYAYSDQESVREELYRTACQATATLLLDRQPVFSPVVHSHPLVAYGLPADWSFWRDYNSELIKRCDELAVLMVTGWRASAGVQEKIQIARELGKPVRYLAQSWIEKKRNPG